MYTKFYYTMEIPLTFNSDSSVAISSANRPENFTTTLSKPLILPTNQSYEIALYSLNMSYSWYNIEPSRNNDLISYYNGTTWKDISFASGIYSYTDINNYIQDIMFNNGDYTVVSGENVFDINIDFSVSSFLVSISVSNGYRLDLVSQAFADLIGFNSGIITELQSSVRLPNITNSLENIYVHSSLCQESIVDGQYSDVIFVFSTANLSRSYAFQKEPTNLLWQPFMGNVVSRVQFYITDYAGRIIDLNGISTSFTVVIRSKK